MVGGPLHYSVVARQVQHLQGLQVHGLHVQALQVQGLQRQLPFVGVAAGLVSKVFFTGVSP